MLQLILIITAITAIYLIFTWLDELEHKQELNRIKREYRINMEQFLKHCQIY